MAESTCGGLRPGGETPGPIAGEALRAGAGPSAASGRGARIAQESAPARPPARESSRLHLRARLPVVPARARGSPSRAPAKPALPGLRLGRGAHWPWGTTTPGAGGHPQGPRLRGSFAGHGPHHPRRGRLRHRAAAHPAGRTRRPHARAVLRTVRYGPGRHRRRAGPRRHRAESGGHLHRYHHRATAGACADHGEACDTRRARLPYPQDRHCPFGVGGERGAELAAHWAESVLDDRRSGAAASPG